MPKCGSRRLPHATLMLRLLLLCASLLLLHIAAERPAAAVSAVRDLLSAADPPPPPSHEPPDPPAPPFSLAAYANDSAASWDAILRAFAARQTPVSLNPSSRFLLCVPAWTRLGVANNLEAMTLCLFTAMLTERMVLFPHADTFYSIFDETDLTRTPLGRNALARSALQARVSWNATYRDLNYGALAAHFRNGGLGRAFHSSDHFLIDVAPDTCGFPYAAVYDSPHLSALLARLGEWQKPFSKFLFRFKPGILRSVRDYIAALPSGLLAAVQMRRFGIWRPPPDAHTAAARCLCPVPRFILHSNYTSATIVLVTDLTNAHQRSSLLSEMRSACGNTTATVTLSPSLPRHVIDHPTDEARLAAAFDLALLAHSALVLVSPASSFGYVGARLGNGTVIWLGRDLDQNCHRKSRSSETPPWFNPSYEGLAMCSLHDAKYERAKAWLYSGVCDAQRCPLCSCVSNTGATASIGLFL